MNSTQPLEVVACMIEHEGRFLITQRHKQSHLGHLWEFPGGKVEPGESLEQCAVRECLEEIGVRVKPIRVLSEVTHAYSEVSVHLHFMACTWESGEPQALDCAAWTWAAPEEFGRYEFPAADQRVIEEWVQSRSQGIPGKDSTP